MAKTQGKNLAVAFCEAIGLDPSNTKCLTMSFTADSVVRVEAVLFVTDEQEAELVNLVAEYEFVRRET